MSISTTVADRSEMDLLTFWDKNGKEPYVTVTNLIMKCTGDAPALVV